MRTLRNAVRAREGAPRLPVRRLARHGQDLDGEDPRGVPELRARADDRAVRGVRVVRVDRARELARRDRDGRGVEQLGRRHPRAARERRLRAGVGPAQGVHPRRGAHALDGGVERVPEDARGAAAEHGVRARDDRGAEGAGDGRRPLPPLRLPPPDGRADRERGAPHRAGRVDRDPARRRSPRSRARRRAASATRSARSSSCVTYSGREIALEDVLAVLGVADAGLLEETVDAVAAGDARRALHGARALRRAGPRRGRVRLGPRGARARAAGRADASARCRPSCRSRAEADARSAGAGRARGRTPSSCACSSCSARRWRACAPARTPRTRLELALVKAARPEVDGSMRALLARIERLEGGATSRPRRSAAGSARRRIVGASVRTRARVRGAAERRRPSETPAAGESRPRQRRRPEAPEPTAGPAARATSTR